MCDKPKHAIALSVVYCLAPILHLSMDEVVGLTLIGTINGTMVPGIQLMPGKIGSSLYSDGTGNRISFDSHHDQCYENPDECNGGVTFAFWLEVKTQAVIIILDTGGSYVSSKGYTLYHSTAGGIVLVVIDLDSSHVVSGPTLIAERWYHVVFSWSAPRGGGLYINGCPADVTITTNPRSYPFSWQPGFGLADSVNNDVATQMAVDELLAWHEVLGPDEVWQLYIQGGIY